MSVPAKAGALVRFLPDRSAPTADAELVVDIDSQGDAMTLAAVDTSVMGAAQIRLTVGGDGCCVTLGPFQPLLTLAEPGEITPPPIPIRSWN